MIRFQLTCQTQRSTSPCIRALVRFASLVAVFSRLSSPLAPALSPIRQVSFLAPSLFGLVAPQSFFPVTFTVPHSPCCFAACLFSTLHLPFVLPVPLVLAELSESFPSIEASVVQLPLGLLHLAPNAHKPAINSFHFKQVELQRRLVCFAFAALPCAAAVPESELCCQNKRCAGCCGDSRRSMDSSSKLGCALRLHCDFSCCCLQRISRCRPAHSVPPCIMLC